MKHLIKLFHFALLFTGYCSVGQTTYQKLILPGVPYSIGAANDICSNGNNGFAVVGSMRPGATGSNDILIFNIDVYGNLLWSRTIGSQTNEAGNSIQILPDNSFIALGTTVGISTTYQDILLSKIDNIGNVIWSKSIATTGSEYGYSIDTTSDNGFIFTGNVINNGNWNFYLVKADSSGNIQWSKSYGDTSYQSATCVKECVNGDFILTGSVAYFNAPSYNYDNLLIRTDSQGNVKWSKTYGGPSHAEAGNDVSETIDGGFIVSGATTSYYGNATLLKTDSLGTEEWFHSYGGYFNPGFGGEDDGKQVLQSTDGSYYFTGTYVNLPYTFDPSAMLVKVDSLGSILWAKYYKSSSDSRGYCLYGEGTNEILVGGTGYVNNGMNVFLLQTDSNGYTGCYDSIPDISLQPVVHSVNTVAIPEDTIAFVTANYFFTQNTIGIDSTICLTTGLDIESVKSFRFKVYPNPFTFSTTIESDHYLSSASIELYSTTGILMKQFENVYGLTVELNSADLSDGIYFLLVKENGLVTTRIKLAILN